MNSKTRFELLAFLMLTVFITQGAAKVNRVSPDTASKSAPYFLLKNKNGYTINIAGQKGKILFLNFWALSCIPCKAEMPSINQLHSRFLNDTNILIIPIDLDYDLVKSGGYMSDQGFGLSVYSAVSAVPEVLFHGQIPTTVVIDKYGKIVLFHEGEDDYGSKGFY